MELEAYFRLTERLSLGLTVSITVNVILLITVLFLRYPVLFDLVFGDDEEDDL